MKKAINVLRGGKPGKKKMRHIKKIKRALKGFGQ